MIKKIKMENLNCSVGIAKIEKEINNLCYVNKALFNINTQTMTIDFTNEINLKKAIKKINKIVNSNETGVKTFILGTKIENKTSFINSYTIFLAGCLLYALNNFFTNNFLIFLLSYILISNMIIKKSLFNIKDGHFIDENVLMLIATIAAIYINSLFEAVLVIVFYTVGEFFQQKAIGNARSSINSLIDLKIDYANLVNGNDTKIVDPSILKVGDIVLVKQGEKIPIDGVVIKGNCSLDTKSITGESKELVVSEGSKVISGMINIHGILYVKASKEYSDSTINKIVKLIEGSANKKAKTEKFISKFARIYTPIIVTISFLIIVIPVYGFNQDFNTFLYRACVFLVISCPCALVLSIPLSYFAGIGKSAKNGILFKGSNYLDNILKISDIYFDKTGTLTKGDLKILDNSTNKEALKYAASLEKYSTHPIAKSIVEKVKKFYDVKDIKEIAGKGLVGKIKGKICLVGNHKLMQDFNIINFNQSESLNTLIYVAYDGKFIGEIELTDEIKDECKQTIDKLKKRNINVHMLTGDNEKVSNKVANELKISYQANLLPIDKVEVIENNNANGLKAFIGDGINDGPALAISDIGISMGKRGSDIALEASDIIIMDDNLNKINKSLEISYKTNHIVKQNIMLTIGTKILFLGLGAIGFSTILLAVFADVGISLIAVLNSMRIINNKL